MQKKQQIHNAARGIRFGALALAVAVEIGRAHV